MRRAWIFVPVIGLLVSMSLYAKPAKAQEEESPALSEANIRVAPDQDGVDVLERITLTNVQALDGEIEHVSARPEDPEPIDVSVTSDGRELPVDRANGELMDTLSVSLPEGASGDFQYRVSYRYPESGESVKVPMIVPELPTDAVESNVSVELLTPEGEYLQDSFPLFDSADDGTMSANMVGFPSYTSYTLSDSPAGLFTRPNLFTGLALLLIAACCAALVLYERNARTKTKSREVADV